MPLTRILRRAVVAAAALSLLLAGGAAAKPAKPPVVSSVTSSTASVFPGDSLTATATLKNSAHRASAKRDVYFYLVAASGPAPKTPQGLGVGTVRAVRVGAGATKRVTSPAFRVPASTGAGSYYVLGCTAAKCKGSMLRVASFTDSVSLLNTGTPASAEDPAELYYDQPDGIVTYPTVPNSYTDGYLRISNIGQATTGRLTFEIETIDGDASWTVNNTTCRYLAAGGQCLVQLRMYSGSTEGTSHGNLRVFVGGQLDRSLSLTGDIVAS